MALAIAQKDPASGLEPINGADTAELSLTSVGAGSLLVVTGSVFGDPAPSSGIAVEDDVNGSWTVAIEGGTQNGTYDDSFSFIAYFENSASGSPAITITFVDSGSSANVCALEITGAKTSGAHDESGSAASFTVSTDAATASGQQIAIACTACEGTSKTWTTPTDYTDIGIDTTWDRIACSHVYDMFSGGSTKSCVWGESANNPFSIIATFLEDSGGTTRTADGTPSLTALAASGQATRTSVKITGGGDETWNDGDTGLEITGTGMV